MDIIKYCHQILDYGDLASKVEAPESLTWSIYKGNQDLSAKPQRHDSIRFSSKQLKFPKNLKEVEKKAQALNAFANHELLAIEIMARMICYLPHTTKEDIQFKKAIFHTLKDEQRHFKLYEARMNQLGYNFGDFPLNDFFWKQTKSMTSKESYLALMALTFESANLDFASFYQRVFSELGDIESAKVMQIVYDDEISHVALGGAYFSQWKGDATLWEYYRSVLPYPMTPARSKGKIFNREARAKAQLDPDFIKNLEMYSDNFSVTHRKEWKN